MNIKTKIQPKIHNRFDIFKKNVVTGEEKQVGYAENIVLNQMWSRLCSGSTYFVNIHYGTGTGTLDPSRTSLFTHLGTGGASTVETVRADPTSHWRRSITLGLTTAVGAELTEVGIAYGSTASNLVTHAQIRDMNGNVISILKTDVDIITIYATVYVTLVNTDANFRLVTAKRNNLLTYLLGGGFPEASFSFGAGHTAVDYPINILQSNSLASLSGSWSNDVANKKRITSTMRMQTDATAHLREIALSSIGRLVLPVSGVYSGLVLSSVPIGIGDGETQIFNIPSYNVDNNSLVIKVNGVSTSVSKNVKEIIIGYGGAPSISYLCGAGVSHSGKYMAIVGNTYNSTQLGICEFVDGMIDTVLAIPSVTDVASYDTVAVSDIRCVAKRSNSSAFDVFINNGGSWSYSYSVSIVSHGRGLAFSPDGVDLIVPSTTSPYLFAYREVSGVFTNINMFDTNGLVGAGSGCAFSPDGSLLAVAHSGSPYITMYEKSGSTWIKMSDVSGGFPASAGIDCAFSPDGSLLAVSHASAPYLTVYENISGTWTKTGTAVADFNPNTYMYRCSFSDDGNRICISKTGIFENIGGTWTLRNLNEFPFYAGFTDSGMDDGFSFLPEWLFNHKYPCFISAGKFGRFEPVRTEIEFATAPAVGAVITADYTVNGIHKTDQRVIDISGEIQFGEPTP